MDGLEFKIRNHYKNACELYPDDIKKQFTYFVNMSHIGCFQTSYIENFVYEYYQKLWNNDLKCWVDDENWEKSLLLASVYKKLMQKKEKLLNFS